MRRNQLREAIANLEEAVALRPNSAVAWTQLGNAWQDAGRKEAAIDCYREAVRSDSSYLPALQNLGFLLVTQGNTDEGRHWLQEAQQIAPSVLNELLIRTSVPVIHKSAEDLRQRRQRLVSEINQLVRQQATVDAATTLVPTSFFTAYQGENDRELNADLGRIYRGRDHTVDEPPRVKGIHPRVGFLSAYFCDHTIGQLNLGRIERLAENGNFEIVVLSVGKHEDPTAQAFRRAATRYVEVPNDVAAAGKLIAAQNIDLLLFTEVGMDALTYALAFSRMAPAQAVTWGHPVTTGSSTMDYFVSSELLETPEGDSHYTEKLVRLPSLGIYYRRPQITGARKTRADFGLPSDRHLYACPQTLFKFHPDFDAILAGILRADRQGELVLIAGPTPNWTRLLWERFARVMPDVCDRVRFLPTQKYSDFLSLLSVVDVMLDPLHFGGGNTSYEALAFGTPIITLPGPLMRSRITQALYRRMELMDLVVDSPGSYITAAVELGTKPVWRRAMSAAISAVSPVLFENERDVADLEQFLLTATA